jgi:hypothetical protein
MTVLGKILVFIVLVLSLVNGAFVTMIYTTRTHWVNEFDKLNGYYKIALASEQAYKKAAEDAEARVKDADRLKDVDARLKSALAKLKTQEEENDKLRGDLKEQKSRTTHSDAVVTAGQNEINLRQHQVETIRKALKAQTDENVKLVKLANEEREKKVAAEIALRSETDRANRVVAQLEEMTRELVRVRAGGGAGAGRVAGAKNPPPENVEGLIKNTDPSSGLVTLTIGSDAGLSKGHTLEVFRLSNVPHQSKYLGTIRILEVTATQAVGQPTGRMAAPPQAGDRVASHILGS